MDLKIIKKYGHVYIFSLVKKYKIIVNHPFNVEGKMDFNT